MRSQADSVGNLSASTHPHPSKSGMGQKEQKRGGQEYDCAVGERGNSEMEECSTVVGGIGGTSQDQEENINASVHFKCVFTFVILNFMLRKIFKNIVRMVENVANSAPTNMDTHLSIPLKSGSCKFAVYQNKHILLMLIHIFSVHASFY